MSKNRSKSPRVTVLMFSDHTVLLLHQLNMLLYAVWKKTTFSSIFLDLFLDLSQTVVKSK